MAHFNKFYVYSGAINDLKFLFMCFSVTVLPLEGFFVHLVKVMCVQIRESTGHKLRVIILSSEIGFKAVR